MTAGRAFFGEPMLQSVTAEDFEELAAIRVEAMRDSLERVGRFDVNRARERLRASFYPEHTWAIVLNGARVGFFALRPAGDGWHLDHLYVRPAFQGRGIGQWVVARVLADADRAGQPVKVTALKESPANRFYQRSGFARSGEGEWDVFYVRAASEPVPRHVDEKKEPRRKQKVGAFIIRDKGRLGRELLLFTQPDCPEAPIQIPGGSVDPGEDMEAALWREIREETGLTGLTLVRKIGVSQFPSTFEEREVLERHCYLLSAPAGTPERWIHRVGGDGADGGMRFAFEWRIIRPDFALRGDLGVFLNPEHLPELYDDAGPARESAAEALNRAIGEPVEIGPYDKRWPELAAVECARLLELFPTQLIAIEHIGSTAVPGLAAKPILDLHAGVASLEDADALIAPLCAHGYVTSAEFNAKLANRRWLMRHAGGRRTHHLHVVVHGTEAWRRPLVFRDALRRDAALAERYVRLKRALATRWRNDREGYTRAKTEFVESVLAREDRVADELGDHAG